MVRVFLRRRSKGVVPDVLEPFSPDAAWTGVDGQFEKAVEIVNGLEGRAAIH